MISYIMSLLSHSNHLTAFFDYFISFHELAIDNLLYILGSIYFIFNDSGDQWVLFLYLMRIFSVIFAEMDLFGLHDEIKLGFMFQIISIFNDFIINGQILSFISLWGDCVSTGFSIKSLDAFYFEFGAVRGHQIICLLIYFNNLAGVDAVSVICFFFENIDSYDLLKEVFNLLYCIWYVLDHYNFLNLEFFNNIGSLCLFLDKGAISSEQILNLINILIEKSSKS